MVVISTEIVIVTSGVGTVVITDSVVVSGADVEVVAAVVVVVVVGLGIGTSIPGIIPESVSLLCGKNMCVGPSSKPEPSGWLG